MITRQPESDARVESVRRFSRLYTQRLGLLEPGLLDSGLPLPQARLLFEIAHQSPASGTVLARELNLDPGYVSRLLAALHRRGLVRRRRSAADGRRWEFRLSAGGSRVFRRLDRRSRQQVAQLLGSLSGDGADTVIRAMDRIRRQIGDPRDDALVLRSVEPGDIGWVVSRHGALYAEEYGWDATFEALVARIGAGFLEQHDPKVERGWIAERHGDRLGSAFLVRADAADTAKIRLVLVEPRARGTGLGRRLVHECIRFARASGYRRVTLWTNDVLSAARHIYRSEGFTLESSEPHHSFGHDLVGEHWTLTLPRPPG